MSDKAQKLLMDLYRHPSADESVEYLYSSNALEKSEEIRAFQELQDLGYVTRNGAAIGFIIVSITPAGKRAAERL